MKKITKLLIVPIILYSCTSAKVDYKEFKKAQDYTVPLFADSETNKTALFVFPHPDDEIVCGGTIDHLKKSGWNVNLLTLTQGQADMKTTRLAEWKNVVKFLQFDHSEIFDLPNNTWDHVVKNDIVFWYDQVDSVEHMIYSAILKYQPSVVFSFDTAFGGYGHPEHRISAVAVNNVFQEHKSDSLFPVKRIFQNTLPDSLEQLILGNSEAYKNAKLVTGNTTLPNPTVAFDISKNWSTKRTAASLYTSQAEILKKFYLLPGDKDTMIHFQTFDREYYYEIKK